MDKDNKVLLGTVFIIIVALFFSHFNDITGASVSKRGNIHIIISPDIVAQGQRIYITITTDSEGVNKNVEFYHLADNLLVGSLDLCSSSSCSGDFSTSYVIPQSWHEGVYGAKIYSYTSDSFVTETFTIDNPV